MSKVTIESPQSPSFLNVTVSILPKGQDVFTVECPRITWYNRLKYVTLTVVEMVSEYILEILPRITNLLGQRIISYDVRTSLTWISSSRTTT